MYNFKKYNNNFEIKNTISKNFQNILVNKINIKNNQKQYSNNNNNNNNNKNNKNIIFIDKRPDQNSMPEIKTFGFIILRHVNDYKTNLYWQKCYDRIRYFYPENSIIIIDDNSNKKFVTEKNLYKTTIINSEYHGRGELLPYYYYLKNRLFDVAVILHDSTFIQKYIDIKVDKYKFLWNFNHNYDQIDDETKMLKLFNNKEILNFYENKHLWKGCFGGMAIIDYEYLSFVNNNYNISNLLSCVLTRYNRCSFERVIACLLQMFYKEKTLLCNIKKYCNWGITFEQIYKNPTKYKNLPILKVWTGR